MGGGGDLWGGSSMCLLSFMVQWVFLGHQGTEGLHILYGLLRLFSAIQKCGHYSPVSPLSLPCLQFCQIRSSLHSAFILLPAWILNVLACHSKPLYQSGFCCDNAV